MSADMAFRGYRAVIAATPGGSPAPETLASFRCQIDIVEAVSLPAQTTAFFRTVPLELSSDTVNGRYRTGAGVQLSPRQLSDKTPVLLHEYLHAFHFERMSPARKEELRGYLASARTAGVFPAGSYMLTNPTEFFAMTASAYLYGAIRREPFSREALRSAMPAYYGWLGETLEVPEVSLASPVGRGCG